MWPERIPVEFIIMYRALHLMEFAEKLGRVVSESLEDGFWCIAEKTLNRNRLDEDFYYFPYFRTLTGTGPVSSNTNSGAFLPSKYANVY